MHHPPKIFDFKAVKINLIDFLNHDNFKVAKVENQKTSFCNDNLPKTHSNHTDYKSSNFTASSLLKFSLTNALTS